MSCKTPASIGRSLSPSNESRFVPRPSVAEDPSVNEEHFAGSGHVKKASSSDVKESEDVSNTTPQASKEPNLVADDEKSSIVGATICFTPEPSPPSSPYVKCGLSTLGSLDSNSDDYIGSLNCIDSGNSGVEGVSSKMSSSAMHFASSLDGRSTTEYEILDGISSGTIKVEELSLDEEEQCPIAVGDNDAVASGVRKEAENEANLSLSSSTTVPSLNATPFKMFKSPQWKTQQLDEEKIGHVINEGFSLTSGLQLDLNPEDASKVKDAKDIGTPPKDDEQPLTPVNNLHKTVPSLSETPLEIFKTPQTKTPQPDEKNDTLEYGGLKLDLNLGDTTMAEDPKDEDSSDDTSPKVDEQPLSPFKNLYKYWEGHYPSARTTIGRKLDDETPRGDDLNSKEGAIADIMTDILDTASGGSSRGSPVNAESTSGDQLSSSMKSTQSSGIDVDEPETTEVEGTAQLVVSNTNTFSLASLLSSIVGLLSFVAPLFLFVGTFLYDYMSSIIDTTKAMVGRILLGRVMELMASQDTFEAGPPEYTGTNLSSLFQEEAFAADYAALQTRCEENNDVDSLNQKNKGPQKNTNQQVIAVITAKCTRARCTIGLSVLVSIIMMHVLVVQSGVDVTGANGTDAQDEPMIQKEMDLHCFSSDTTSFAELPLWKFGLLPTSVEAMEKEETNSQEEDNLYCFSTHTTSFAELPLRNFNLLPTSFEAMENEDTSFAAIPLWKSKLLPTSVKETTGEEFSSEQQSEEAGSSSWVFIISTLSIAIFLVSAFIFKENIPFPARKAKSTPRLLTGTWTEDEHEQFLAGYNLHGSRWKLVSVFVPSRTYTQVKSRGSYWLSIGSPLKMKRIRKAPPSIDTTPKSRPKLTKKKIPETPGSISSTKSTPRQSNKAKAKPLKGILIEKDSNKLQKNVTPRSERRTRSMAVRKMEGCKSDPVKKVRIQIP